MNDYDDHSINKSHILIDNRLFNIIDINTYIPTPKPKGITRAARLV